MKEYTLAILEARVKEGLKRARERQRYRYQLARSLGFSAAEAVVLQNWAEAVIKQLAEDKGVSHGSSPLV